MLLRIEQLSKSYRSRLGRRPAVRANDGITLEVDSGQVYGLLGHNGAGKTTLVNQVVGLLRPDAGTILIDGRDAVADPGFAREACSLQPQAQLPIDGLSPRQAIELLGRLRGGEAHRVRERRANLVDALDLGEWLDTDGEKLSGGVKRLVSFAMAAVVPGRVVVLDEPTNDVDPLRRRLLWSAIRTLADQGAAVLLVTHNVLEAERAVDRLAILDGGHVVAEGTPARLKDGLEHELRLELTLEAGTAAPPAPPFSRRYVPNGSRALALVSAETAGEAVAWAEGLRRSAVVTEYALVPASLEDVYVALVSGVQVSPDVASRSRSSEEVRHARAA
jgi:ABC-2 type transport system ATP-binding protein